MMKEFDFHSCENCIFHKIETWYDEEGVEFDYCEMIEWDTKDKNECLRFMPRVTTVVNNEYLKPTEKIYIKEELKPREVEFALVEVFDDRFEFERN